MSDTESQEKGSSRENEDPVNAESATEHAETRDESAIDHVKKPYDKGDMILRLTMMENLQEKRDLGIPRKERKTP